VGYVFGLAVAQVLGPMITGVKGGSLLIDPLLALGAIFLSSLIGILSSAYPAIRASKMDPTTALRAL
jgi:putative ABC transport system permease protein